MPLSSRHSNARVNTHDLVVRVRNKGCLHFPQTIHLNNNTDRQLQRSPAGAYTLKACPHSVAVATDYITKLNLPRDMKCDQKRLTLNPPIKRTEILQQVALKNAWSRRDKPHLGCVAASAGEKPSSDTPCEIALSCLPSALQDAPCQEIPGIF